VWSVLSGDEIPVPPSSGAEAFDRLTIRG